MTSHPESASKIVLISLITFLFAACSSNANRQPNFYPNSHYNQVGPGQARADTEYCKSLAAEYVRNPNKYATAGKSAAVGAVGGAATGAVAGTILKGNSVGRTTAAGAAIGAIAGLASGASQANKPNPEYDKFVETCLQEKGYRVYGWTN